MIAQLDPLYVRTRPQKALVRVVSHLFFQGRFATTKYRWLNGVILSGLACIRRFPQLATVESPIFIVGTGRSGTTVLGKVLSMHREIGMLNEPKAMWYTICSRADVHGHFHRGPATFRLSAEEVTPDIERSAQRLFGNYLAVTGSKRVVDKNPEIVFRIPFVRTIFPDARFIFLVRNGWDTIISISTWSKRYGKRVRGKLEDWWGVDRRKWQFLCDQLVPAEPLVSHAQEDIRALARQEDMAAVEWVVTMQQGLRSLQALPGCMHLVRYEDLTHRPENTLEKLLEFCGLSEDTVFLTYAKHVLTPVPCRKPLSLHPVIQDPFLQTMEQLNYLGSDDN